MDVEVRKAFNTIFRAGITIEDILKEFPKVRHNPKGINSYLLRYAFERDQQWEYWAKKMPVIVFPPGWRIRIIPPSIGAIVRFLAEDISVYLDCHGALGAVETPYWEIYPSADGDTERFDMEDIKGLIDGLRRAVDISRD